MTSFRTRRHPPRHDRGRPFAPFTMPMVASIAAVALTLMLIGVDLAGNTLAFASINPTPTPSNRVIDGPFRPIDLPTKVPTRDSPVLGVPTEPPATEEAAPTEEAFPTEDVNPTEEPTVEERRHVPEDGISVSIWKLNCPEGTASNLTSGDYAGVCQGIGHGIEFTLTSDTGTSSASTNDEGKIGWSSLTADASGELLIRETIPDGYGFPAVFCGQTESDILTPAEIEKVDAGSGTVSLIPASASSAFSCWWYNIPMVEEDGDNSLTIWKLNCPEGTASDLTEPEYAELCTEPGRAVEFELTSDTGERTAATNDDGRIGWSGIAPFSDGTLVIEETLSDGYGTPEVFCGLFDGEAVAPATVEQMDADSFGTITLATTGTFRYTCWWYNIPTNDEAGNAVRLWKYYCPPGTASDLSLADYEVLCTDTFATTFTLTDADGPQEQQTDANGYVRWVNVNTSLGNVTIQEKMPSGYVDPQAWCVLGNQQPEQVSMSDGFLALSLPFDEFQLTCRVYNIPTAYPDNMIEVRKFFCPVGTSDALTSAEYIAACTEPLSPTTFTLTDPTGSYEKTTDVNGFVGWLNVSTVVGQVAIAEKLPVGYGTPQVFCTTNDGSPVEVPAAGGYFKLSLPGDEFRILCEVFNIPTDLTSSLTIVKYTCPVGYDLFAPGANPGFDCPTLTDGIPFVLDDGMPGLDIGGMTGDSGQGVVSFADVEPGAYTVEEVLMSGMGDPFVLKCDGDVPQLQPYPLWQGNHLPITLHPGQAVTCFWYNVPAPDPDTGTLTVTKYACTTEVFVSAVDCQVYEGGQTMDLLEWDGVQWNVIATATTDAFGRIVWTDLPIGHYLLAEHGTTWCHMESSALLGNDGSFNINQQGGMDQTVDIYNCGFDPEIPEGTPTDWPNTGVGDTHSSTRVDASDERRIPPVEGGDPATPTATRCLAADDPQAATGDDDCPRGAVPSTIRIEAIGVNAPVEVKETVGGQMQQPTGETAVAWYKESPRLGETGNMLFAGHLNWWGIPEAVFFRLGELQEGDEIVVTDASGAEWTYRVEWVRQDEAFVAPSADVVGPTDEAAITLITCGGDWNAEAGLYDKRTVVRAVLVSGPEIGVTADRVDS